MEFLLTYGWAILVVIVAIAALAFFGGLNPDRYLPDSCIIDAPGLSCRDHSISYERYPAPFSPYKNILRLSIINGGGQTFTLKRLKVLANNVFAELPYQNLDHDLNNRQTYLVKLDLQQIPPVPSGTRKVRLEFILEVENPDTGLKHNYKGFIRSVID